MAVPPGVYHLPPFKLIAFSFESAAFESQIKPQGPEEMCLSLETNMVYFDRGYSFITHLAILLKL